MYVLEEAGSPPSPVLQDFQARMSRQEENEAQLNSGQKESNIPVTFYKKAFFFFLSYSGAPYPRPLHLFYKMTSPNASSRYSDSF